MRINIPDTLTYDFGETPEAVVRERLETIFDVGETEPFEIADAIINAGGYADDPAESDQRARVRDFLATFIGPDDLLTVLDALLYSCRFQDDEGNWKSTSGTIPAKLRIDILAALGIKER